MSSAPLGFPQVSGPTPPLKKQKKELHPPIPQPPSRVEGSPVASAGGDRVKGSGSSEVTWSKRSRLFTPASVVLKTQSPTNGEATLKKSSEECPSRGAAGGSSAVVSAAASMAVTAPKSEVIDVDEDDELPLCPMRATLRRIWGYKEFREGQEEAVTAVMQGRDALVIMPTGGGKSLTYMLPGVLLDGLVLIVSPLLALIADQLKRLKSTGLPAACLNSTLTPKQKSAIIEQLLRPQQKPQQKQQQSEQQQQQPDQQQLLQGGPLKFLFVTPEQIATASFQDVLRQMQKPRQQEKQQQHQKQRGTVALVAVDEAHCISSWGHDFRSSYRRLGLLRSLLPGTPVLACTATATAAVQKDICESLKLENPVSVRLSFNRPNILYEVRLKCPEEGAEDDDECVAGDREAETEFAAKDLAREIKQKHSTDIGIVYCLRKKDCEIVAEYLKREGIGAAAYHAGLSERNRNDLQHRWMEGLSFKVLVATVAFGLGVDNPHVRFVVHFSMPKTIEAFYQESGRGGRDGLPARSILYYSSSDYNLLLFVLQQQQQQQQKAAAAADGVAADRRKPNKQEAEQQHQRHVQKLKGVLGYCRLVGCRRKYLLQQFGETYAPSAAAAARCCDNCSNPPAANKRALSLSKQEMSTVGGGGRRRGHWGACGDARSSALEIETQELPDKYPKARGRVVYKNQPAPQKPAIPESIRQQGLSAVMKELERREQQEERRNTCSSSSKKHHALFAEFRTASSAGRGASRPAAAATKHVAKPALKPATALAAKPAEGAKSAPAKPPRTLGLCRTLGLSRTRPSP